MCVPNTMAIHQIDVEIAQPKPQMLTSFFLGSHWLVGDLLFTALVASVNQALSHPIGTNTTFYTF